MEDLVERVGAPFGQKLFDYLQYLNQSKSGDKNTSLFDVETTSTTVQSPSSPWSRDTSSPWTRETSSPWTRERRKRPSSSSTCSSTSTCNFSQPPSVSSLKSEQISCKYLFSK